jgi:vacuolar-type H+-ATPase subunit E/Vma4
VAVETLLARLEQEAAAERARIAEAAEREATEIEREAQASAERALAAEVARVRAEGELEIARQLASVARAQRERILRARSAIVDRAFAEAERMLSRVRLDRYRHRVPRLIEEVLRYLEHQPAALLCSPEVAPIARETTRGLSQLTIEASREAMAGVVGRSEDGAVTVENTWTSQLARRRPDLAIALMARLGETDHDALG